MVVVGFSGERKVNGLETTMQRQTLPTPAVQMEETTVAPLGREDALEEGIATHTNILAWRIPVDRGTWWAIVHGVAKSQTQLS